MNTAGEDRSTQYIGSLTTRGVWLRSWLLRAVALAGTLRKASHFLIRSPLTPNDTGTWRIDLVKRQRKHALRFGRGKRFSWSVDLVALKRQLSEGTLAAEDRNFIEQVLPGFCDFAEGKVESWPVRRVQETSAVA